MSDHFARLGLPRRFSLDLGEVEREYLLRSRSAHPDFHQEESSGEQQASLELSSALNEAYSTLRDPFRRAEHLLQLEGGSTSAETKDLPPGFLERAMEWRMAAEELRMEGFSPEEVKKLTGTLASYREEIIKKIVALFELLSGGLDRERILLRIRAEINAAKFVTNILRDLRV